MEIVVREWVKCGGGDGGGDAASNPTSFLHSLLTCLQFSHTILGIIAFVMLAMIVVL